MALSVSFQFKWEAPEERMSDWMNKLDQQINEKESAERLAQEIQLMQHATIKQKGPDLFAAIKNDIAAHLPQLTGSHLNFANVRMESPSPELFQISNPSDPGIVVRVQLVGQSIRVEFLKSRGEAAIFSPAYTNTIALKVDNKSNLIMTLDGKPLKSDDLIASILNPIFRLTEI